jgi:hypothetical protein
MRSAKKDGLTRVTLSSESSSSDLVDPLSLFASQQAPAPKQTLPAPASNIVEHEILRKPNFDKNSKQQSDSVSSTTTGASNGNPTASNSDSSQQSTNVPVPPPQPTSSMIAETETPLLSGEKITMRLGDLLIQTTAGKVVPGTLLMTTYRILFIPSPAQLASMAASNPSIHSLLSVPLGCISRFEREKKLKDSRIVGHTIIIHCKDVRQHKVYIQTKASFINAAFPSSNGDQEDMPILTESEVDQAYSTLGAFAFPTNLHHVFAFGHRLLGTDKTQQLRFRVPEFDYAQELIRQGVLDEAVVIGGAKLWRISYANAKYKLCKSYPRAIIVPASMSDEELSTVAAFRSGQRLPAMTWICKDNGASLWRSAQPKGGVSGTCAQDEMLLDIIARSCTTKISPMGYFKSSGQPLLVIMDCRSKASAMANRAAGAGYELPNNYPTSRVEFMNIGNIHVMRDSFKNLCSILLDASTAADQGLFGAVSGSGDISFGKQIEDTGWLTHVRLVLKAAWETAVTLKKGIPVLVHCSHGKSVAD